LRIVTSHDPSLCVIDVRRVWRYRCWNERGRGGGSDSRGIVLRLFATQSKAVAADGLGSVVRRSGRAGERRSWRRVLVRIVIWLQVEIGQASWGGGEVRRVYASMSL